MAGKPEYRALIQPIAALSERAQRELVAPFEPAETYVCSSADDFEAFLKQIRPPRVALVAYAGLLAEQRGNKLDRVDHLAAMKAGIHRRGGYVLEAASRRRSDKAWPAMKRDGEDLCRRLAQGRRSALNGRRGARPYEFADRHVSRFVIEMAKDGNDAGRLAKIAAYCKRERIEAPGRTWLKTKLNELARSRGLI